MSPRSRDALQRFVRSHGLRLRAALFFVTLGWPGLASAQSSDAAAAQALFDQAGGLVRRGRYAEACRKLEESQRLDPGIGTLFHLANCYEKVGRLASAWAGFLDVASQARAAGQADRQAAAQERADRLVMRLGKIAIVVPPKGRFDGLHVERDGTVVGEAQWGVELPVDGGKHEIRAEATGRAPFVTSIDVTDGRVARVEIPVLEPSASAFVSTEQSEPPRHEPPASSSTAAMEQGGESSSLSGWVLGLGVAGVVGLTTGATLVGLAVANNDASKATCPNNRCDPSGLQLRNDARAQADAATIAFAIGGAAAAAALVVWWLDEPDPARETASRSGRAHSMKLAVTGSAVYLMGKF